MPMEPSTSSVESCRPPGSQRQRRPRAERVAGVPVPKMVLDGGTTRWLSNTAEAVAAAVTDARRRTLRGQLHNVAPDAIAPALQEFFAG
jgi:hypothetical protein